jgi:tetratricopeptide (TPR) repeat protein
MRIAREGAELAARNGSHLSLLWLTLRQAWAQMEAFDFENALPVCERIAADPTLPSNRHMYPAYLWLGMARLGYRDYEGAWEALEKLRLAIEEGGQAFRLLCPLLHAQTECAIGRKDLRRARTLAGRLIEVATEHHESGYEARGHRLLAEIAIPEGDWQSAAEYVSKALAALARCEAWNVEWRVHATASHVFFHLGRHRQSDEARERSFEVARRVADTLVDEPALQKTFLKRVAAELEVRASSAQR